MAAQDVLADPCLRSTLQAQLPCLDCFSKSEKEAAFDYLMAIAYLAVNRSGDDLTTLRQTVICMACEPSPVLDSFLVKIAMNLAVAVGALDAEMTAAELKNAIRCWQCGIGTQERKAILVLALCGVLNELGVAPSP